MNGLPVFLIIEQCTGGVMSHAWKRYCKVRKEMLCDPDSRKIEIYTYMCVCACVYTYVCLYVYVSVYSLELYREHLKD